MCCFIEQCAAYMQCSSSRMFAPAVNTRQSDAQQHGKVYLKSLHPLSKEAVAARNKFCEALGPTSTVQLWSAQYVSLQTMCPHDHHSNVLRLMLHSAWHMMTKHPYT